MTDSRNILLTAMLWSGLAQIWPIAGFVVLAALAYWPVAFFWRATDSTGWLPS